MTLEDARPTPVRPSARRRRPAGHAPKPRRFSPPPRPSRPVAAAGRREAGMTTAEYAVGTLAAAGLAALFYQVVTSGAVSDALQGLVERALSAPF